MPAACATSRALLRAKVAYTSGLDAKLWASLLHHYQLHHQ